jgi:chloramphenicol O-acetyltransferase
MTLNLDLTGLLKEIKKQNIKLYPTMINLLSMIVNKHEEFRTAIDKDERVGVFDFLLYFNALQKESIFFRIHPSTPQKLTFYIFSRNCQPPIVLSWIEWKILLLS